MVLTSVKLAGQLDRKFFKIEEMLEFSKYLYAEFRLPHPLQISKIYPRNGKANQMGTAKDVARVERGKSPRNRKIVVEK